MEMAKPKVQRYEKYKNSGVIWLGDIPKHWEVESFKNILTERNEKNAPIKSKEILSLSIDKGVTLYAEKTTNLDRFKDDFTKYKLAYKGDLVLNSMNMIVGAVGVSDYFGCVSPVYYTYHGGLDNSYTSKFYEYLFRCKTVQGVLYSLGKGLIAIDRGEGKYNTLRLKVSRDDLRSLRLPFPNLSERTAIVTYLNRKTALIDQAIGIKQKQIELLKERRQILIHKAVTRGLNPNVQLKDSGVKWIGEIPESWEVKKLKYCLTGKLKYGANESGIEYDINLPRYIRITDFGHDGRLSEDSKLSLSWKNGGDYLLNDGDILFARSGATVGKTYQFKKTMSTEDSYCFAGYLIKAAANEKVVLSDFLYLYTNSDLFNKWKEGIFIKATIENIGADKYCQLLVIIPPLIQQKEILAKYKLDDDKIATAISLKEQEIEKLKEYKATLINSAVTGKIKVC
ncbi:MAG: restriction endonuclease subunit S [Bacteroidota bacterium]|nr:restriction endonuclease subunit S [Bacteroidota bacterium]